MLRRHICHQQFGKRYQTTQPHPLPDIDTDGFGYGKVVYLTNSRMHRNKQIAIILPDTLQSIGLQSMLTDYFPPVEISHYPTFEAFSTSGNDTFDYYFTNAALFVLYAGSLSGFAEIEHRSNSSRCFCLSLVQFMTIDRHCGRNC